MGQESGTAAKLPQWKMLLVAAIVAVLIAVVVVAVQRELAANKPPSAAAAFTGGIALSGYDAPALTVEEEAYAAAMWPIHSEVKLAAVRMIFAGLNYKTENRDAGKLKSKVQPLTQTFLGATKRVNKIQPPASLQDAHDRYKEALGLYTSATREMVRIAEDGKDEHLVLAQQRSERASLAILKLSDVLWPGEYKPN
ncbi:MAG TPA: hypothetical protein VGR01_11215 [Burkholderiales bacterium]|jgi:hypothetical protein|nr:hypothetical protein [Burkholderiales bacterium]